MICRHPLWQPLSVFHVVLGKFLVTEFKPRNFAMLKEFQHLSFLRSE